MIIPGRPVKGYSKIENFFNDLKLDLNTIDILTLENLKAFQERYIVKKKNLEKLEKDFNDTSNEIANKYIKNGENVFIAHSIADDKTSIKFQETYDSIWLKQQNNIRLKEISVDNVVKSTIILLHSTIEGSLYELCLLLQDEMKTKIKISDITESKGYINQSIVFLIKVIGLKGISQLHDKYIPFNKLRNFVVHIQKKDEKIPAQFSKFYYKENKTIRFNNAGILTEMMDVLRSLIESIEIELDYLQKFPTLIKKIGNILWSIKQKDEKVECIDNVLVYSSIIHLEKLGFERQLQISFKPDTRSTNRILINEEDIKVGDYNLFLYFDARLNYIKKVLKNYKKLIKGKRSFNLEIKIYKA